jgi:ribonuclease P protein component
LPVATLKTRAEFLAVRGGLRASVACAAVEARRRSDAKAREEPPRFGFTVTKKLGGAVARNRIRRRLKAAVSEVAEANARAGFDYVIVARAAALDRPFAALKKDLEDAFYRVHHPKTAQRPKAAGHG